MSLINALSNVLIQKRTHTKKTAKQPYSKAPPPTLHVCAPCAVRCRPPQVVGTLLHAKEGRGPVLESGMEGSVAIG